ncbi:MAG: PHB depolymerase family esterase [Pseudomonadota bacterium]
MKPVERFLGRMMEAARQAKTMDAGAAGAAIQKALAAAGLLPAKGKDGRDAASPGMIDLNAPPPRSRHPVGEADAMLDGARRTPWSMPGHTKQHTPGHPPPAADAPGQFLQRAFSAPAGTRHYKLYVPARPATGPRPLIVMLHGCTQTADDFATGTAMNALAEEHGCLVLYPEQASGANASRCWNWFEPSHQERDGGEPSLIAGMTERVIEEWQADRTRVYVAGLSAGGAMAAIVAAAYPDLYAAAGVHSGLAVGSARDLITGLAAMKKAPSGGAGETAGKLRKRVPVIVFHGDQDNTVHSANGGAVLEQFLHLTPDSPHEALRSTRERLGEAGGRAYTKTVMCDSRGRSVGEYWEVHGAGHVWSGGKRAGSYTDPAGPDASAEMLRFFLHQAA